MTEPVNLETLERLAGEATEGDWLLIRDCGKDASAIAKLEGVNTEGAPLHWLIANVNTLRPEWQANARFIHAARPQTILKLVEVARAAKRYEVARAEPRSGASATEERTDAWAALRDALKGVQ